MKIKTLMAVLAVSLSGALATGANAAERTPTTVTIEAQSGGEFFGYVESSDEDNCANGRKVTLFRLLCLAREQNQIAEGKGPALAIEADGTVVGTFAGTTPTDATIVARLVRTSSCTSVPQVRCPAASKAAPEMRSAVPAESCRMASTPLISLPVSLSRATIMGLSCTSGP